MGGITIVLQSPTSDYLPCQKTECLNELRVSIPSLKELTMLDGLHYYLYEFMMFLSLHGNNVTVLLGYTYSVKEHEDELGVGAGWK